jgi:DNA-directed RNA polymerase omega subunit
MLMRDEELRDDTTLEQPLETEQSPQPVAPAPPITSRFLLVNVAAQRAKQLHKGAFPRLTDDELAKVESSKAERLAMEEIRRRLVHYDVPELVAAGPEHPAIPSAKRRSGPLHSAKSSSKKQPDHANVTGTNHAFKRQSVMSR